MTGRQWTTTSPSRTSSSRNTPCVDGCWGPMLTVSSSCGSACAIDLPSNGEVHRLATEWLGPPQRVTDPLVGHHDARQVRMADELDPEQVEDLALVPVG